METRANYVIVGLFTVLAVLGAFVFVYWSSGGVGNAQVENLRFRIPGSASGLTRGSWVMYNGVRVGDIQRVYVDPHDPASAIADATVVNSTVVTKSTTAVVGLAGLTGTANIEMRGGRLGEESLFELARKETDPAKQVAEVIASPSAVTNLLESSQDILARANNVVTELEAFARESRQPLIQTAQNVQKFTDALANNSDEVEKFMNSAGKLADELGGFSAKLDGTIKGVEDIVKAVDSKKITAILDNAEAFSKNASSASNRFDSVVGKVDDLLGSENTQSLIVQLNETLKSYRTVADTLNTRIVPVATEFSQTLASYRKIAETVDGSLGPAIAGLNNTLAAYRQVATTLNTRIGPIADNLQRFSGQGLRDAQALINDARRSVTRIEQAVSDIERNPQRLITGGDGEVRRHNGRTRR